MNIDAIIYTSNTGHTKEYATMLGEETDIPVYELTQAKSQVSKGSSVLYMGWLMAGKVKGYSRAKKIFNVYGLCGVGMAPNGSQTEDIKKANNIPDNLSVFSLQGGFEMDKLSGVYKLMMNTMKNTLAKQIANKKDKSPQEEEMLELILNGGNRVCKESLKPIITWIKNQ